MSEKAFRWINFANVVAWSFYGALVMEDHWTKWALLALAIFTNTMVLNAYDRKK